MKKLFLLFAVAMMTVSASAQVTVEGSKFTDNWSIGIQGGVATKTNNNRWLHNLNANAGLRIGKEITPVFGLVAEGNVYFGDRAMDLGTINYTFAKSLNVNLLGKVNLSNLFGGYKGEPRLFEVSALFGYGWLHGFGGYEHFGGGFVTYTELLQYAVNQAWGNVRAVDNVEMPALNKLTSKAAIDFTFNLGAKKEWQIFIQPSINFYDLNDFKYNINKSFVQLNAGVVYKFKNSNGTHNFKIAQLRDQAEIDALNAQINELRNRKPEVITKEVIKEVQVGKEVRVEDLVFVTFAQGKYNLTNEAKAALDKVKEGAHVQVVGTCSPEGSKELNDRLSQNRANAVADYLKGRGVIVDEAIGKGVQGTTSNRLAIVYVK
jgi:outer membrane protein OmpA-like peptidoglycan-associated protein